MIVDFSSLSVDQTKALAGQAQLHQVQWIDSPVSGGTAGAEQGTLVIFAGGDLQTIQDLSLIYNVLSQRVTRMGETGTGQATKICNQLIVAANSTLIAEAVALAAQADADAASAAASHLAKTATVKPTAVLVASAAAAPLSAGAENLAKGAPTAVKPAAAVIAATSGASVGAAGKAVGAAAPTMLATLANKETAPAGIALRTDSDFTSYKGMVGFQQGSMVLDGLSRQKVAELAPQAREAERVRLRGRVATAQLSEEMKKLAVGRAYAVKVEFVKHEVDKSKIRILSPQQSSGENATGSVRGVDVMIDMPERKTLSGTVKDGA